MKKHISLILAAFIGIGAVIPSAGCSSRKKGSESSGTVTSAPTESSVTTEPATTATTTTTTTAPLMPPMTQPVESFSGYENTGYLYNIFSGPDNTVMLNQTTNSNTSCIVFDPIHNKITRKAELRVSTEEGVGMFSDGTIVTYNCVDNLEIGLYGVGKTEPEIIKLDYPVYASVTVDPKNDCVYWVSDSGRSIVKMERKGNTTELYNNQGFTDITNINTNARTFTACEASEETESGAVKGIFSLDDGKVISHVEQSCTNAFQFGSGCADIVSYTENDIYNYKLEYYETPGGNYKKSYRLSDGNESFSSINSSPECDYALVSSYCDGMGGSLSNLSFIDPVKGTSSVALDFNEGEYSSAYGAFSIFLPEIDRWIIALNYYKNYEEASAILMADPSLLKYDKPLGEAEDTRTKYTPVQVGEKYKKVRQYADRLEDEFGIRILVGNEVKNAEYGSGYIFESVEDFDYNTPEDEIKALSDMATTLRMYPADLFERFKASNGKCGLRIGLCENLLNESYTAFTAGGVSFESGGWYNIVLRHMSFGSFSTSRHHELLHSIEELVSKNHPLKNEEWLALDPPGFSYTNDFDAYETSFNERTDIISYLNDADKTLPYFISTYSLVTPMEDRATLIENLFTWAYDDKTETYHLNDVNFYKDYPHLKAKIDYLAEWTKQELGYVYWEEVLKNYEKNNIQPDL